MSQPQHRLTKKRIRPQQTGVSTNRVVGHRLRLNPTHNLHPTSCNGPDKQVPPKNPPTRRGTLVVPAEQAPCRPQGGSSPAQTHRKNLRGVISFEKQKPAG